MASISNSLKYLGMEIVKFSIPIFLTFLTAFFFSNLFSTEKLFEIYVNSKIHNYLWREVGATFGAITALLGLILIIQNLSGLKWLDHLIDLVLYEIPKNIYLFGGVITGAMYAFAFYVWSYDVPLDKSASQIFGLGSFFGFTFFVYACGAQYLLDKKKGNDI